MQKAPVKEIPGVTPWHGHVWKCFHSAWQQALQKVKSNSSCSKNKTARNQGVLLSESNCVLATDISKLEASFSQKNSVLFCLNAARWHQFLNLIAVWYLMFFHTSFPSWQVKKWSWVQGLGRKDKNNLYVNLDACLPSSTSVPFVAMSTKSSSKSKTRKWSVLISANFSFPSGKLQKK